MAPRASAPSQPLVCMSARPAPVTGNSVRWPCAGQGTPVSVHTLAPPQARVSSYEVNGSACLRAALGRLNEPTSAKCSFSTVTSGHAGEP